MADLGQVNEEKGRLIAELQRGMAEQGQVNEELQRGMADLTISTR